MGLENLEAVDEKEYGKLIAKVLISGDDHLSDKKHGFHNDYPEESFYYFKMLGDFCIENEITHWISLGDFTFGQFKDLSYKFRVEEECKRQYDFLNGNRWVIKGNHDKSSTGMTEYEYFLKKGYFKGSELLQIGGLNINMVDHDCYKTTDILVEDNKQNIILTHGYFTFKGEKLDFSDSVLLDNMTKWYGCPLIVCGHIHTPMPVLKGFINDGNGQACTTQVHYLPCLSRPAYITSGNPEYGYVSIIRVYELGIKYDIVPIKLWDEDKSFNLELIKKKIEDKESKESRVDLKDIVKTLNKHSFNAGLNPEDKIMSNNSIPDNVKSAACEYLKQAYNK